MARLALALLFAATIAGAAPLAQAKPAGCNSVLPWAGTWEIWGANGVSFGKMYVYRDGNRVHGTYTGAVHPTFRILGGWFEGRVQADGTVRGRWHDDGPDLSKNWLGDFRWTPRDKVRRFIGRWKTDLETKLKREWYGKRTGKAPCGKKKQTVS